MSILYSYVRMSLFRNRCKVELIGETQEHETIVSQIASYANPTTYSLQQDHTILQ